MKLYNIIYKVFGGHIFLSVFFLFYLFYMQMKKKMSYLFVFLNDKICLK